MYVSFDGVVVGEAKKAEDFLERLALDCTKASPERSGEKCFMFSFP